MQIVSGERSFLDGVTLLGRVILLTHPWAIFNSNLPGGIVKGDGDHIFILSDGNVFFKSQFFTQYV